MEELEHIKFNCQFIGLLEPLLPEPTLVAKRMFGSLACYVHGRMMVLFAETYGDRSWKGQEYPYDIWNGLLVPSKKERHEVLRKKYPQLVTHPVLKSWLYLPQDTEDFYEVGEKIIKAVKRNDPLFGVVSPKKKTAKKKKLSKKKKLTRKKIK